MNKERSRMSWNKVRPVVQANDDDGNDAQQAKKKWEVSPGIPKYGNDDIIKSNPLLNYSGTQQKEADFIRNSRYFQYKLPERAAKDEPKIIEQGARYQLNERLKKQAIWYKFGPKSPKTSVAAAAGDKEEDDEIDQIYRAMKEEMKYWHYNMNTPKLTTRQMMGIDDPTPVKIVQPDIVDKQVSLFSAQQPNHKKCLSTGGRSTSIISSYEENFPPLYALSSKILEEKEKAELAKREKAEHEEAVKAVLSSATVGFGYPKIPQMTQGYSWQSDEEREELQKLYFDPNLPFDGSVNTGYR